MADLTISSIKKFNSLNRIIFIILIAVIINIIFSFSTLLLVSLKSNKISDKSSISGLILSDNQIHASTFLHDLNTRELIIYQNSNKNKKILTGQIGNTLEYNDYSKIKTTKYQTNKNEYDIEFNAVSRAANVKFEARNRKNTKRIDNDIVCNSYEWLVTNSEIERFAEQTFEDCFLLGDSFWYGGAESYDQQFWPINNVTFPEHKPYLTGLFYKWSSIMERYWLSSSGVALIVDQSIPLFVNKNKTSICLQATAKQPYNEKKKINLKYDICQIDSQLHPENFLNRLQLFVINNYFSKPTDAPDKLMFKYPIWSTWANYKKKIDENSIRQFAHEILANNYTHSQIEIDDKWQTEYGDFTFDVKKFPNITNFITELNDLGFRTTLWVHPFANPESKSFFYQSLNGLAVKAPDGKHPALTSWWDGLGCVILDTTNPNATNWFVQQLENLRQESKIDSFKFDAGEIEWLPKRFNLYNASISPDQYSINYAKMAAQLGDMIEVRTGCQTQDLPIFVRMLDKDSRWGMDNGLKTVLTTSLLMSILGYPYILPDMIGGNAYSFDGDNIDFDADIISYPDDQLYVRWAQLTTFLPSMQFSIPPWHYNNISKIRVNEICQNLVEIHSNIVYPVLMKEIYNTITDGSPLIRPLWWINNSDQMALTIDDEFLVGNDILVAPIFNENSYQRDIYLPKGNWKSENGTIFTGPIYLKNYFVPIEKIPYFFNLDA